MGMLQIHESAMNNAEIALHDFLLSYKSQAPFVYGLVEGKDDPHFYNNIINIFLPEDWGVKLIPAGCRDNVIALLRTFDWNRFSRNRICFFVDRDLSAFLDHEFDDVDNLYVTDGYSIENEFYRKENFYRIMKDIYDIDILEEGQKIKIDSLIDENFEIFKNSLSHIMAQIIFWQRSSVKVKLNSIEIKKIFTIRNGVLAVKEEYFEPIARIGFCAEHLGVDVTDFHIIDEIEKEFAGKFGKDKFIRGKYVLWLFVESLLSLCKNFDKFLPEYSGSRREKISVGLNNALVVFGPRVRYPDSLRNFINKNYASHIASVQASRI